MEELEALIPLQKPVLTRIFYEEMTQVATEEVRQRVLVGFQQKLSAEGSIHCLNDTRGEA